MPQNPAVIFLLMTYNQQAFVGDAVRAALAQDYQPLTIVISDDGSADSTYDIIEQEISAYRGPHRVSLYRTPSRLGSVDHFAKVMAQIAGDFIVMAHGDDVALPSRTARLVTAWRQHQVSLVSSNAIAIDETGERDGFTCANVQTRRIPAAEIVDGEWGWEQLGAALAFEPAVVTAFRPLTSQGLAIGLDHVLPLRALALKGFHYIGDPLLLYRRHAGNMTHAIAGTADRHGGESSYHEIHLCNELAARMHALDDIALLLDTRRGDQDLAKLQVRLAERVIRDVRWVARLRARLRADGLVPRWLPAAQAAAIADAPLQSLP